MECNTLTDFLSQALTMECCEKSGMYPKADESRFFDKAVLVDRGLQCGRKSREAEI